MSHCINIRNAIYNFKFAITLCTTNFVWAFNDLKYKYYLIYGLIHEETECCTDIKNTSTVKVRCSQNWKI